MSHKQIVILYHGGCPDGFGAAYSAWKKFGDTAEYIPVKYESPVPHGLEGRDLFMVDFCYDKEIMLDLVAKASSLTVLDHHEGIRDVVESMPHFVFDANRSGAGITWSFFHPDKPLPLFISYVQDADLNKQVPEDERTIITYSYAQGFNFHTWDDLVARIEDPKERAAIIEKGRAYLEYFSLLTKQFEDAGELVEFEGYICYLAAAERMFIHSVGIALAEKHPPFALIVRAGVDGLRVSMRRSKDSVLDLAKIAQKYGGNGHPGASAFSITWGTPVPWKRITTDS
jgi:hypothetical protein